MKWTSRPTKTAKYWLSLRPDIRRSNGMQIPDVLLVEVDSDGSIEAEGCRSHSLDPMLAGAKWLPYMNPPDPFVKQKSQP